VAHQQTLRDPSLSITERCRRVATYFADENGTPRPHTKSCVASLPELGVCVCTEIRFWTLAGHFLAGPPQGIAALSLSVDDLTSKLATLQATPTTASGGVAGGDGGDDPNSRPPASAASIPAEAGGGAPKLEFGVLCSSRTARTLEWERARASELASANITYDLSRKLTDLRTLLRSRRVVSCVCVRACVRAVSKETDSGVWTRSCRSAARGEGQGHASPAGHARCAPQFLSGHA
jgi:hypothetical protein